MAIFRGVGGSGSSSDNSFLQEVTAQATTATTKANEASASATSAEASATSAANSLATIQNTEVTSASFNTGDGVLTLTKLGGATVTADLDGRFLTSYTETNDLSSAVTWVNVPNAYITAGSVTQHQAALTITESQISDLQSYLTSYTETNNLTTAVTWANVPDANITESSVTQHQGALSITESQISDLQTYLTAETNDLSTTVTWANVPDANITQSSVTQHQAALSITESQISDLQTYLTTHQDISGKANLSGATFTGGVSATGFSSQYGGISSQGGDFVTSSGDITTSTGTVSGATISGTTFTCNGNMTVSGTVDGVDIATRDAVLTSTTTTANSALQDLVDDTTPQLGGDLDLNGNDITGTGAINIGGGYNTSTGSYVTSSGNLATNVGNIIANSGTLTLGSDATIGGNVVVTGTVDGRDVATDGAKLDTLERFYRTRFRERYSVTSPFQYLTNTIADIGTPVYTKSTTGSENTLDFYLGTTCADYYDNNDGHIEVVVTAPLPTSEDTVYLGTASNPVSDTSGGTYSFDVTGDFTHHLTDYCGMSVNSDGSNAFLYGQVRSNAYYNPNTNKTTITCNLYQGNKPALYQTVYLHPFDWENSGTDIIGSTIQIDEVVYNSQKMSRRDFSVYLGYFKSKVPIQLRGRETSSTTDNIAIRNFGGVITQIED